MTESNAIDNPVFEKESNSLQSVEVKSADDQALISSVMNPVKNFGQEFAKNGPLLKLKIVNWVLILLLTIFESIGQTYTLTIERWSRWYNKVNVPKFGYAYDDGMHRESLNYMNGLTWLWLVTSTFSLVMYYFKRKNVEKCKIFLSCLALMDVCFWTVFFLNIPLILLTFVHRTITEYLWFYPRLINGTSLDELTEYTPFKPYASRYDAEYWYRRGLYTTTPSTTTTPVSTTYAPDEIETMETRRNAIIARLFLDPIITIIALFLIVLSLVYVWRIRSAIKRTNLWESDYKKLYPQCSKLDAGYAKLWPIGVLKVIHWILPVFLCIGPSYFLNTDNLIEFKISTAFCYIVFLYRWISYIKTVRFRNENLNDGPDNPNRGLGSDIKLDSFFCLLGITFYLVWWNLESSRSTVLTLFAFLLGVSVFVSSLLANVRLMYKYNGFCFKTPLVSINVSIKVNEEKITIERKKSNLNAEDEKIEDEKII